MLQHAYIVTVKQVGANGQISLGKEYAGKQVQVSQLEDGALLIQPGVFIPDNEHWLHTAENKKQLDKAIRWAETTPRHDNFNDIVAKVEHE